MSKLGDLRALEEEIEQNETLPLREANLVFGEGDVDCEVLFTGEAPGFHEDQQKRPFVGRGGQLLNKLIESIGWKREDVYITNIVKRRPPDNRDPLPEEIEAYKPYLTRQIEIINPKIIAPLGRFSMNYFLPNAKITRDQGKLFWWGDRLVIPIFHPAAALRSTGVLEETKRTFIKLKIAARKFDEFTREREEKAPTLSDPERAEGKVTKSSVPAKAGTQLSDPPAGGEAEKWSVPTKEGPTGQKNPSVPAKSLSSTRSGAGTQKHLL